MTIEEVSELKREAENKIVDILNDLVSNTKCAVTSVHFSETIEQGYTSHETFVTGREVNITLVIK